MTELVSDLVNGVSLGAMYALIALGYTMVYGVLKLINFAHADVMMVGAFVGYYVSRLLSVGKSPAGWKVVVVFAAAMAACALLGFVIERGAYRPLRGKSRLNALITAIGVSLLLENGGQLPFVFGTDIKTMPDLVRGAPLFSIAGAPVDTTQALGLSTALLLMVILHLVVFHTRFGTAMRAVSFNPEVASLMGVPVNRVISSTFVLGSALAGGAGVLYAMAFTSLDPVMGLLPGIKAFVAAVLGGIGSIGGAMVGGVVLGVCEYLAVFLGYSGYKDAVAFAILIVILLVRPAGLFGRSSAEKV
jgi:branched-chain amino acid transport system permease protein